MNNQKIYSTNTLVDRSKTDKDLIYLSNNFRYTITDDRITIKPFMIDFVSILENVGMDKLIEYIFLINEILYKKSPEGNLVLVVDCSIDDSSVIKSFMEDFGSSSIYWTNKFASLASNCVEIEPLAPETFREIRIINSGILFESAWNLVSYIVPQKTTEKIIICSSV